MSSSVKTGLIFVFGGICGAILSRRNYMRSNPLIFVTPEGRPIHPPCPRQRRFGQQPIASPAPPPPPSSPAASESSAATAVAPAKE